METDNVTYIDEFRRERWLLKLQIARESGTVAVFGALQDQDATVLQFPSQEGTPDDAA